MNTAAQILPPLDIGLLPKVVLCIGLDEPSLDLIRPLIGRSLTLKCLSFMDLPSKIKDHLSTASFVLLQWDGIGKKAHKLLLSRENRTGHGTVPVHMIMTSAHAFAPLTPRQSRELAISGWIEFPQKYFEIQRLLYDLTGALEDDPTETENLGTAGGKDLPHTIPLATGVDKAAGEEAESGKPLTLLPPPNADYENAARRVMDSWRKWEKEETTAARSQNPLATERLVIVHPEESFATEISNILHEIGVQNARCTRDVDQTMLEVRRGATGVIVWFDGTSRMVASLLEHLTESRQLAYIPVLVVLPSRDVAEALGGKLRGYFFDAIYLYDRKPSSMLTALKSLRRAGEATNTPRGILELLRRPLKLESPPEKRRSVPLEELENLAQKLMDRPGKKYWGLSELIPHIVLRGDAQKAQDLLRQIEVLRPHAYNTHVLRSLVARLTPEKDESAMALAKATLNHPDLSADRLYRTALMLERWKSVDALHVLLEGWAAHPVLRESSQLIWMAGKYYLLIKQEHKAEAFLSQAAILDPMRADYAEALARGLAGKRQFDRVSVILRSVASAKNCSWNAKVLLAYVHVKCRNIKEAHEILDRLLEEAPENQELLSIKAKLA